MSKGWLTDLLQAASVDPDTALLAVPSITSNTTVPADFALRQELAARTSALAQIASGELTLIQAMRLAQEVLGR